MRVVEEEMPELPGQEAFLDVLTNMVGMIILLVVVMGLRASRAPVAPETASGQAAANEATESVAALDAARRDAMAMKSEVAELVDDVLLLRHEAQSRDAQRQYLVTHVAAFQQELDERRAMLSTEERREFDLRCKLVAAQRALDDVTQEHVGLLSQAAEVQVIENRPTPIARRATGKRLYMQLRDGYVTVLPDETFEELLAEDFKQNLWRLREEPQFSRTIDGVDGFRLRYFAERRKATVRVGQSAEMDQQGEVAMLTKFDILPSSVPNGETIDDALLPDSNLSQHLKKFPADNGVLVIFVFRDCLDELHSLKRKLGAAGYSIAEAPIEQEGIRISFDGTGYKLFAQ